MHNKLFIAAFNGCRQLLSTSFYAVFWVVTSESSKLHLNVHLSFQTKAENTMNPDVTLLRFCTLCSSVPPVFILDFTRLPPAFFPSVRLLSSKFHIAVQQRGWLRQSHQNTPRLCSVKSTCRVVCFILVVLLCRLHCNPRGNGRAPDGKRANDGLLCSLCNSSIFEFNSATFMIEFISSVL